MSTVPEPVLGPTGYVEPSSASVLTAVLNDINTAFGGGLNATTPAALSTPQGQLATSLSAIITDKNDLFLNFVNQVDPQYAQGSMQDAIGLLYFMTRLPATSTNGPCTCTGLPGTVILPGAQATDTSGNLYACADGGTIPLSGEITLTFSNVVTGPIPCLAGALNKIYVATPGWSGITNPGDLTEGTDVESSQAFELRRQASVAANAVGSVDSVRAAVLSSGASLATPTIPSSVYVTENFTGATVTVGGVPLKPHSLYVATVGGDPASIAEAIWDKKSIGCDMNGGTTVVVTDTDTPGQPSYNISFQEAIKTQLYVSVTLKNNALLPANIIALVQAAIADLWATPNNQYGQIGSTLYAGDLYAAVMGSGSGVQIININVGVNPYPVDISVTADIEHYVFMSQDPLDWNTYIAVGLL